MAKGSKAVRIGGVAQNVFQAIHAQSPQTPLSYSTNSVPSAAFGANVSVVRVVATTACHIAFGANPTATTNSMYLPAGVPEYFGVTPGEKLAVIRAGSDGVLHIMEGTV